MFDFIKQMIVNFFDLHDDNDFNNENTPLPVTDDSRMRDDTAFGPDPFPNLPEDRTPFQPPTSPYPPVPLPETPLKEVTARSSEELAEKIFGVEGLTRDIPDRSAELDAIASKFKEMEELLNGQDPRMVQAGTPIDSDAIAQIEDLHITEVVNDGFVIEDVVKEPFVLTLKKATYLKTLPYDSTLLGEYEKFIRRPNDLIYLDSYSSSKDDNHLLIKTSEPFSDFVKGVDKFYVYKPDIDAIAINNFERDFYTPRPIIKIETTDGETEEIIIKEYCDSKDENDDVAFTLLDDSTFTISAAKVEKLPFQLKITQDTTLKSAFDKQSTELSDTDKVDLKKDTILFIDDYDDLFDVGNTKMGSQYLRIMFDIPISIHTKVHSSMYLYKNHFELQIYDFSNVPLKDANIRENEEKIQYPEIIFREKPDRGIVLDIPLYGEVWSDDYIIENGHFTWGESLHCNRKTGYYRKPSNAEIVRGIEKIAMIMEEVRTRLGGRPIYINSWYRDPATNRRVGGASRSRHLSGDAVDFVVKGLAPYTVHSILKGWYGRRGGLASSTVFTHVDGRGYSANWSYPY